MVDGSSSSGASRANGRCSKKRNKRRVCFETETGAVGGKAKMRGESTNDCLDDEKRCLLVVGEKEKVRSDKIRRRFPKMEGTGLFWLLGK